MKVAIISLTKIGASLAGKIAKLTRMDVFCKRGTGNNSGIEFDSLKVLMTDIFSIYDGFVFIMATGIVVRMIAPFIVNKRIDPAVVVINESGEHVISLLSGHIGGANRLTKHLADLIHAIPVITTATDVNKKIAADLVAVDLGLDISSFSMLKRVNIAIAEGQRVPFYIDAHMKNMGMYLEKSKEKDFAIEVIDIKKFLYQAGMKVIITERDNLLVEDALLLHPRKIVVGIGCRRNVTKEEIIMSLNEACILAGADLSQIQSLASTVVKENEVGLLEACKQLQIPIYFYRNAELNDVIKKYKLECSEFVQEKIGVGNVCEAAAMLASQSKKLILPKMKMSKVAIAIAWAKSM